MPQDSTRHHLACKSHIHTYQCAVNCNSSLSIFLHLFLKLRNFTIENRFMKLQINSADADQTNLGGSCWNLFASEYHSVRDLQWSQLYFKWGM